MYEELVAKLRDHNACISIKTLDDAADAIDELDTLLDGVSADNDALCETIERMKKPRWIPVTERLPEGDGNYLVVLCGNSHEAYYGSRSHIWLDPGKEWVNWTRFVTHWMPLPAPPKEETE